MERSLTTRNSVIAGASFAYPEQTLQSPVGARRCPTLPSLQRLRRPMNELRKRGVRVRGTVRGPGLSR
jgi:hypothetical protein